MIENQRPRFVRGKRTLVHGDCTSMHAMVTLAYQTLQSTLKYDMVIWHTWVRAGGSNVAFEIVADRDMVIIDTL